MWQNVPLIAVTRAFSKNTSGCNRNPSVLCLEGQFFILYKCVHPALHSFPTITESKCILLRQAAQQKRALPGIERVLCQ